MRKGIVVLGSTGSVGRNTLEVIAQYPDDFRICALTANHDWQTLARQARVWKPEVVVVHADHALALQRELRELPVEVLTGPEGLEEAARHPKADTVVSAIVGTAGLRPTLAAIRAGKHIALANKETLVTAGPVMTQAAQRHGIRLLPVDSEHSAIFQCLQAVAPGHLRRILLTASGGPFRGRSRAELTEVTPEESVAHPRWDMGRKISVDSATLMNKGLEVIEAHWLFDLPVDQIEVVIHPQSIIHSLVELIDGAVLAHLNLPDMRHPIQYALTYPERKPAPLLERLDLAEVGTLTFERPDLETFECLKLALQIANLGGTAPAALNAANEVAVEAFLARKLGFLQIADVVRRTVEKHTYSAHPDLEELLAIDRWARDFARTLIEGGGR